MIANNVFIVIVLYKVSLSDSPAIKSLEAYFTQPVDLLVYDNSPNRQYEADTFVRGKFNIRYLHNGSNPGLSKGYNHALHLATESNFRWLLLVDQDTAFTQEYVKELETLNFEEVPGDVAAIVPKVIANKLIISPAVMTTGGRTYSSIIPNGVSHLKISGINSGTLVNVFFMNSITGFNEQYPLDMLDHWYFREIFRKKRSIYVMSSSIFQELSVMGAFENNVSIARYEQMLKAEYLFNSENGIIDNAVFRFRLCTRLIKQFTYVNKRYSKLTLKYIFNTSNFQIHKGA